MTPDLPENYGQVIYESYRNRVRPHVGEDALPQEWHDLVPDDQACWDGAASDLIAYLRRIPG